MSRRGSFEGGAAFNYTPRINNKPNAQGTLFQVNPDQRTSESRQPRGYSPERYGEVTQALGIRRRNTAPLPDGRVPYGGHEHGGWGMHIYPGHAETIARAVAAVARSTVPMEDITRPDVHATASLDNPNLHAGVHPSTDDQWELGHYTDASRVANHDYASIALQSGRAHHARNAKGHELDPDDNTIIHEIGHHVHAMQNGGKVPYADPSEQGHAEGTAEGYAYEHARTPGYRQRKVGQDKPKGPEAWSSHRQQTGSYGHYDAERFERNYRNAHPALQPRQFDAAAAMEETRREMGPKTYPKGHIQGQQSLLYKTTVHERGIMSPIIGVKWGYSDGVRTDQ